ncbi:MAG: cupredoxin family copper-binding protein [Proteobacteria bacterium]|nr:cupredoxin family copper-binding protein [Pseudomonadota bacterium]
MRPVRLPGRLLRPAPGLLCAALAAAAAQPATHTITVENMVYSPASLTVHRGDRITWVNKDLFPHTASALGGAFDSGAIAADGSWSYVAAKSGDFAYDCRFHPTMHGRLKVDP